MLMPRSALGSSVLVYGLVQAVGENWLLSIGTPLDAYSWLILGLTLRRPGRSRPIARARTEAGCGAGIPSLPAACPSRPLLAR